MTTATSSAARRFDVVIFGATGFTGGLVARYLAQNVPQSICRWAIAGRSRARLEQVKSELEKLEQRCREVEVLEADSADSASLERLAGLTHVVMSTVGPFTRYGEPLIAACVNQGTDYCDITGETPWVRKMIDKYHAAANEKHVRIVPMCGFDSIPADLGSLMVVDHLRSMGKSCRYVRAFVIFNGSASGGTMHSAVEISASTPAAVLGDAFLLNPADGRPQFRTSISRDQLWLRYDSDAKVWTSPFVMAIANTRVVRRSAALMDARSTPYGPRFEYNECEPRGLVLGFFFTIAIVAFTLLLRVSLTRSLLQRFLPDQGTGPSQKARDRSYFTYALVAESDEPTPATVYGLVAGGDPGYTETSKMLAESAMCLALDRNKLPDQYGVLTPASGMGQALISRLRHAGLTFSIENHLVLRGNAHLD